MQKAALIAHRWGAPSVLDHRGAGWRRATLGGWAPAIGACLTRECRSQWAGRRAPTVMETTATVADRIQDARVRGLLATVGELAESALGASDLLLEEQATSFAGGTEDRAALGMLREAAAEFARRSQTHRQRRRASAVLIHAAARLQANLRGGQRVRRDGFFGATPGDRAAADEFAEAVLVSAIVDPEEA